MRSAARAAIVAGVLAGLWAPPAGAEVVPPRLTGVTLQSTAATVRTDCSAGAGDADFAFAAEGVSSAPYPGAFSESGTFGNSPNRLAVEFTIVSGTMRVEGRKFPPFVAPGTGVNCGLGPDRGMFSTGAGYEALIQTPSGTFLDRGTTVLEVEDGGLLGRDSVRETFRSQFEAPLPIEPVPTGDSVLLFVDEDSIDNGLPPNFFSAVAVNDHIAKIGLRTPLPAFDGANIGRQYTLHTGQVGDEGWFAPRSEDPRWAAAGTAPAGIRSFVGQPRSPHPHGVGPGLGAPDAKGDRESRLDKVRDVVPLRASGLAGLVGKDVCAVVWDSDISINYDKGATSASLKGETLGTVAFRVLATRRRTDGSSGSLPAVDVQVADAGSVCAGELALYAGAPVPRSSSEPYDTGR